MMRGDLLNDDVPLGLLLFVAFVLAVAIIVILESGCAAKQPQKVKLPVRDGVFIHFVNVAPDGTCKIQETRLDAKSGEYTAICKPTH